MKITLESTSQIIRINGVPCRMWQGATAKVSLQESLDASEFDAELRESPPPIAAFRDITDLRFVGPDE